MQHDSAKSFSYAQAHDITRPLRSQERLSCCRKQPLPSVREHPVMKLIGSHIVVTVGLITRLCCAQNCPFLGPAYPAATDLASPAFIAASIKFDEALSSNSRIDRDGVSFAVEVYSSHLKDTRPIHRRFNTALAQNESVTVGPHTLFRIHSISKVLTVYTMLSKLSFQYWHEPITKYVPELANNRIQNVVSDVDWSEVTLGSLASQISGVSRDCTITCSWCLHCEFSILIRCSQMPLAMALQFSRRFLGCAS